MSENAKKIKAQVPAKPYEPTPQERAVTETYVARREEMVSSPRLKVSKKGNVVEVAPDHPDMLTSAHLLMQALGTTDPCFLRGLLYQVQIIIAPLPSSLNRSRQRASKGLHVCRKWAPMNTKSEHRDINAPHHPHS
jgi:hypothetical protein